MKTNKFILTVSAFIVSAFLFAEEKATSPKEFRTFVSIENVSEETTVEVKLPDQKPLVNQERGKRYEIPYSVARANQFRFVVQMAKGKHSINPCEFMIDQVNQFDRAYVCTAQGIPNTQVVVRVFTNLHGGDRISGKQILARR